MNDYAMYAKWTPHPLSTTNGNASRLETLLAKLINWLNSAGISVACLFA